MITFELTREKLYCILCSMILIDEELEQTLKFADNNVCNAHKLDFII